MLVSSPRLFVNCSVRLDPDSDHCRRRLEKALRKSAPRLFAIIFADFESRLLEKFNLAQRQAYFKGELDQEVIRKACAETRAEAPRGCSMARSTSDVNPRGPDGI